MFIKQKLWGKKSPYALKLLAWQVKEKRASKYIHAIKNPVGEVMKDSIKIAMTLEKFYTDLYSGIPSNSHKVKEFLTSISFPSISLEHKELFNSPTTWQECMASSNSTSLLF